MFASASNLYGVISLILFRTSVSFEPCCLILNNLSNSIFHLTR